MTPKQVKKFYKSLYNFNKQTRMSASTLSNWLKSGKIPIGSQLQIERLTEGKLTADWDFDKK